MPSSPAAPAFDLHQAEDVLTIGIHRDFDTGSLHQDWSTAIIQRAPGPVGRVVIDLSRTGLLSSTFFAGIIRLHQHYTRHGTAAVILQYPDPRTVRNLAMLRMTDLFTITPRA